MQQDYSKFIQFRPRIDDDNVHLSRQGSLFSLLAVTFVIATLVASETILLFILLLLFLYPLLSTLFFFWKRGGLAPRCPTCNTSVFRIQNFCSCCGGNSWKSEGIPLYWQLYAAGNGEVKSCEKCKATFFSSAFWPWANRQLRWGVDKPNKNCMNCGILLDSFGFRLGVFTRKWYWITNGATSEKPGGFSKST